LILEQSVTAPVRRPPSQLQLLALAFDSGSSRRDDLRYSLSKLQMPLMSAIDSIVRRNGTAIAFKGL